MLYFNVDFHTHTCASEDSLITPGHLIDVCKRKGVNRVVVTDHNTIVGAHAAKNLDPDLVIIGEEIMTTHGEILAAFVSEEIPPHLSPRETIYRLRSQGSFISISHPFDTMRSGGWNIKDLIEITPMIDAIEVFNARCISPSFNRRAKDFANKHSLAGTAGSDAHTSFELGRGLVVLLPFSNSTELRNVIATGKVKGRLSPFWVHFFSRYASLRNKLGV